MSTPLTINNITYQYPSPGEDPGWDDQATGWAQGVTDVINNFLGPNDILAASDTFSDGSSGDITGLIFSPTAVRSATIEYNVYRKSDEATSGYAEAGIMHLVYDNEGGAGNKWLLSRDSAGDALFNIDINEVTGQMTYTATSLPAGNTNHVGIIQFRARTFAQ